MESKKKRIVILLGAAVLAGFALRLCSGQSSGRKPEGATTKAVAWGSDPNSIIGSDKEFDTGELFLKMMGAVVLIIAMGVGLIYVSKRFLPKIGAVTGRQIQIAETAPLGARKTLHLVKVGGRKLLIGSTVERITMLADLSDAFFDSDEVETGGERELI